MNKDEEHSFFLEKELKVIKFDIKVRDLLKNYNQEIKYLKSQIDALINNQEKYEKLESTIKDCVKEYFIKIRNRKLIERNAQEESKINEMKVKIEKLKFDEQIEKDLARIKKSEEIQLIKNDINESLNKTSENHLKTIKDYDLRLKELLEYRDKYENEIKRELCVLKKAYETKIYQLKAINQTYKMESSLLNRKLSIQEKSLNEFNKEYSNKENQIKLFSRSNAEQEKMEKYLQENLMNGDQMTSINENKVNELRAKCAELEKFNFVHKFTYDELILQKIPIKHENKQVSCINEKIKNEILFNEKKILRLKNELSIILNKNRLVNSKISSIHSYNQANTLKNQRIINTLSILDRNINTKITHFGDSNSNNYTNSKLIQEAIDEIKYLLKYDRVSYYTTVNRQYKFLRRTISKQKQMLVFKRKCNRKRLERIALQKLRHQTAYRHQIKEINDMAKKIATLAKVEHFMKKHNLSRMDNFVDEILKSKKVNFGNENEIIKANEIKILELKEKLLKMNDLLNNRV